MPAGWGAAIGAVGSIASGALQSGAISGASSAARGDARMAAQLATKAYAPFVDTGSAALHQQSALLGLNGPAESANALNVFQASPGYQYALGEGTKAVDSAAASKGMLRSGATLKAEQTLGNNLASLDFGNYVNRLNALTTLGFNATGNGVNAMLGQANNMQQIGTQAGTQQAGIVGNTTQGLSGALANLLRGLGNNSTVYGNNNYGFGNSVPGADTSGGAGMGVIGGIY